MSTNQNPEPATGQPREPEYENKRQVTARLGVSVSARLTTSSRAAYRT
jgi:hypothetical protein